MSDITGGGLSFKSTMDNSQMNAAIDETLRRVQGFSDATVAGGAAIDAAFGGSADSIRQALSEIGDACAVHESELDKLKSRYNELGEKIRQALSSGRGDEADALGEERYEVEGAIVAHERLLKEYRRSSDELQNYMTKIEQSGKEAEKTGEKYTSLRTQIRKMREELIAMEMAGLRGTSEYRELQEEVGRLTDAYGDATQQANILAHDQRGMQGLISAFSGFSGVASAAQGALSLFGAENENVQKAMLKVQSLMSVTIGLQQVQQMLDKDSAFQLVTVTGLKEWWAKVVATATGVSAAETAAVTAETAAEVANAAATDKTAASKAIKTAASKASAAAAGAEAGAQSAATAAAVAGTAANLTLAGAFRAVGVAIKSIPVFGWIAAGIGALIGALSLFTKKSREAKKAAEEFSKSMIENAYKPIGRIQQLSEAWNRLGDNLKEKEKFIGQNKKAFEELGVAVHGVTDAENLLISQKDAFIDAQIAKAKSIVFFDQAQEKVKKLMELEAEYNKMPDRVTRYVSTGGTAGGGGMMVFEADNTKKDKKRAEIEALRKEIVAGYGNASQAERDGLDALKDAGIEAAGSYAEGTVGAIEQAIARKQEALKYLTSAADYKAGMKELEEMQKRLAGITGAAVTAETKDPYKDKLDKTKAEYRRFAKWADSGDEILIRSANREFAGLLKEGATYIDYLKRQRDQILAVDVESRTKAQNAKLRSLNDAIAEETKKTVLESFNNELNDALSNAKTAMEMLKVIENRRKGLSGDGTEIDLEKGQMLDEAEKSANERLKQDLNALLDEYAGYAARRKAIDERYNTDIEMLTNARLAAQTDAEKKAVDAAIANRNRKYKEDTKGSGNADYDALLAEYGSFERKKQDIIDEYEEKRRIARENSDRELEEELNRAQMKALSSLAVDEMQNLPDWELLFGDLDEVSTRKLQELLDRIDGMTGYLGVEFDPKDLEALKDKINDIKDEIQTRNPFKALKKAVEDYGKAVDDKAKKKSLSKVFDSAAASVGLVSGAFDSVVDSIKQLGVNMDEETEQVMDDISGMLAGAGDLAMGIATGNPLQIIQGSIELVTNAIDLFNTRDRDAERRIKAHGRAVDDLKDSYARLAWEIERALGKDVYSTQQAAIRNMQQQQAHLQKMWEAEGEKKKADSDKIEDYKEQYAELGRQIIDMYDEIANGILQTDARGFADELGDALAEAFGKGEDASKAFESTVNGVLKNAIVNQIKKEFLEKQLSGALENLKKSMGYWSGDKFVFDGLSEDEIARFKSEVASIKDGYMQAMEAYGDLFKDLTGNEHEDSLTGAVKGVTEETAGIVAGQLQAIRINQVEAAEVMRQQLMTLNQIANNTSYNHHLAKLDRVVSLLEGLGADGTLRAQGLAT